jgi:hypothetical protein
MKAAANTSSVSAAASHSKTAQRRRIVTAAQHLLQS